jgi:hypothetical protein
VVLAEPQDHKFRLATLSSFPPGIRTPPHPLPLLVMVRYIFTSGEMRWIETVTCQIESVTCQMARCQPPSFVRNSSSLLLVTSSTFLILSVYISPLESQRKGVSDFINFFRRGKRKKNLIDGKHICVCFCLQFATR